MKAIDPVRYVHTGHGWNKLGAGGARSGESIFRHRLGEPSVASFG